MIDIVFPKNNEQEFIRIAEKLNLSGICFAYDKMTDISHFQSGTKLRIFSAVMCSAQDVKKFRGKAVTIVRSPDDQSMVRDILEKATPDILFSIESGRKHDFIHHRASGLNHILSVIAREKNVSVGFDFSEVFRMNSRQRAVYLGRMSQNISFARKFRFKTVIASFAENPWHLRSEKDLISFFVCLGMAAADAKDSLNWFEGK